MRYTVKNAPFPDKIPKSIKKLQKSVMKIYKVPISIIDNLLQVSEYYNVKMVFQINRITLKPEIEGDISNNFCLGHYLHELLHAYRIGLGFPVWVPIESRESQLIASIDNLIEHPWIYNESLKYEIDFDPYQDCLNRCLETVDLVYQSASTFRFKEDNFLNLLERLCVAIDFFELTFNCSNHPKSIELISKLQDNFPIINEMRKEIEYFCRNRKIETPEDKMDLIILLWKLTGIENELDLHRYMVFKPLKGWDYFFNGKR
jgi:hypothetical protein